jgi:hypothetical protein
VVMSRKTAISEFEALLATCFTMVSCLAYSLTLKMEAICSFVMSVDFQRTTRRHVSEDRTLQLLVKFIRRISMFISYLRIKSINHRLP